MPLYAYRCTQCGHRFEKIQHFSAEPEKVCPKCHGVLERPLTAPALRFKGAGWYVNDYAAKNASSSDNGSSDAASSSGTDAKPATTESGAKPAATESAAKPASTGSTPSSAPPAASS